MKRTIKIATRDSKLAMAQAEIVAKAIENNGYEAKLVPMKTMGDKVLDRGLYEIGGKGLFLKELEDALKAGEVDICVHSLKDMPVEMSVDYPLVGVSGREDCRDALVLPSGCTEFDSSKPLGCSSMRRVLWIKKQFPEITIKNIRGNINTRLKKLDEGEYGAIILASAGLTRLGMEDRISRKFSYKEILPAAGQGVLGIQAKKDANLSFLDGFLDEKMYALVKAERAFVRGMGADCSAPVAAHATINNNTIELIGWFVTEQEKELYGEATGPIDDPETLGYSLAERLKND